MVIDILLLVYWTCVVGVLYSTPKLFTPRVFLPQPTVLCRRPDSSWEGFHVPRFKCICALVFERDNVDETLSHLFKAFSLIDTFLGGGFRHHTRVRRDLSAPEFRPPPLEGFQRSFADFL